ncbi:hypothetical protein JI721_05370 [Alicyclobacillus cycloheptanicus]|uniref:Competence CoiA-like predicted nuclease n=2 Tax=Alicyclobacillus cycloheptanicus TaxID=1457 RepID=A0ABT9XMU3_9BACL|nr:competence CoiA-like predicted nuclease [Alicyclobacillus cycloheptanicus]WDM02245.1 hypothetical protein JI721_05370 [Alicyclobacillus cycloheptanicus]
MTDSELRIPYALNENGTVTIPDEAARGEVYYCPECSADLVFRFGPRVRKHFAHKRIPENCRFLNEGWLHISAKHAVKGPCHSGSEDMVSLQ